MVEENKNIFTRGVGIVGILFGLFLIGYVLFSTFREGSLSELFSSGCSGVGCFALLMFIIVIIFGGLLIFINNSMLNEKTWAKNFLSFSYLILGIIITIFSLIIWLPKLLFLGIVLLILAVILFLNNGVVKK